MFDIKKKLIHLQNSSYEEGNTTLRKEALATDFIWTDKPLELLGTITSIGFDDSGCAVIRDHELTTDEVGLD
jgi:AdoMet-dependent rRNA methyltransferase SPB1